MARLCNRQPKKQGQGDSRIWTLAEASPTRHLTNLQEEREAARKAEEEAFRRAMMAKFAEDDRLEQLNQQVGQSQGEVLHFLVPSPCLGSAHLRLACVVKPLLRP